MKTKPILDDSRPVKPPRAEERTMNFFGLFSARRAAHAPAPKHHFIGLTPLLLTTEPSPSGRTEP